MKINLKNGFLHIKVRSLSPRVSMEASSISEFSIFIDENAHFFVGFKLENATQYINCEHIGKENFLKMVEFVENNLTIPRKIYLYEQEVTLQFDNIENVYKLTEKNRPDYPTSNTLFYSVFTLVIIGTLAIIFYDLPWLIPVMIIVYIAWFIILWLDWLAELDYFTKMIKNWFKAS
ncbi:MAG: hypothetical protein DRR16_26305 [Candidatus Parabeggiatoa sp. nov. 3]|nr:MAG: hypothetical protein DRR00_28365 [Gammaproteobacteria bacterium]RKZ61053.1 MAG: hypothetical protein DRQ99_21060 [Gammaproteobacteria bacterium]RKZ79137.1 MAG: hypothetical protein DRR16_26305 [Gammaproteobacteria bacterium]